ncbi:hypothetical protein V8C35DRAFT_328423 [Trichoderma chlorosporum]
MSFTNIEYQHFIPQFILRNYSYPFKCPKAEHQGKKKCKCKHEKGKYPGDAVVNCVDLSHSSFRLETYSVKRIFGASNMYSDPAAASSEEQRRIETMFSKMESQASTIYRRIIKGHEAGDTAITLTRIERNMIRKFLFLLKYRGSSFHQQFYHDKLEDYPFNNRELLFEYMKEHRFSTPRDVWYHNLETIMNLEMDPEDEWMKELPRKMFPDDALWFIMHVGMYYMAICTPSELADEFILTENCYNVFEGSSKFAVDEVTGQVTGGYQAAFHEFAPISPRLIIVLRSLALPNPEEDYELKISQERHNIFWSMIENVSGPNSKSMLEDLPIKKCRASYARIINGEAHPTPEYDGKYRSSDKFYFTYYPVRNDHVRIMNNIFLDTAYKSNVFAYRNLKTLKDILETYVSGPCEFHKVLCDDWDKRYSFLRGLETFSRSLGSQKSLVWRDLKGHPGHPGPPAESVTNKINEFKQMMNRRLQKAGSHHDQATGFLELYQKLRGDLRGSFEGEVAQAGKMVHFQAVVETVGSNCSPVIQARNREIVASMFRRSYCSRYWLYLKLLRKSQIGDRDGTQDLIDIFVTKNIREGPEDVLVKTSQLYNEDTLNRLMELTVITHGQTDEGKIENMWRAVNGAQDTIRHGMFRYMVFYRPGKIRDCGMLQPQTYLVLLAISC